MPAAVEHRWTAAEVRALPDEPGKRFECVDGVLLVSPGPRFPHQHVVVMLTRLIYDYVETQKLGCVMNGPGELELDDFTLVQPDIFVLPLVNGRRAQSQEDAGQVLLFVEALSPSTAKFDRVNKRPRYQREGVECWIADVDGRVVECWMPDADRPDVMLATLTWHPPGASEPLTIDLEALFAEALGER